MQRRASSGSGWQTCCEVELSLGIDSASPVVVSFTIRQGHFLLCSCYHRLAMRVLLLLLGDLVGEVEEDLLPTLQQRLLPFYHNLIGYFGALFKC